MDEKLRSKVIAKFEKAIRVAGATNYEEGMQAAQELMRCAYNRIQSIQTIEELRGLLDAMPPMSKREEMVFVFIMDHLPQLLRLGFQITAQKAVSDLPAFRAGRPPALSSQDSCPALNYISKLHRDGSPLVVAKARTARRFARST